ncbi:hypothetical protein LOD99_1868 [Oopsacas minuta]|uniref:Uncharacterized protein n=1 Tax=Oopsacas minuta TaxID=111878 RepID=A0AAV7K4B5_9METZ|nr:hypothetical protein LOD99_1868 [Oopsacas minuta]
MEQVEFRNLVRYLEKCIFPEEVLNSNILSKEKWNYISKASTFHVPKDSKLFKRVKDRNMPERLLEVPSIPQSLIIIK